MKQKDQNGAARGRRLFNTLFPFLSILLLIYLWERFKIYGVLIYTIFLLTWALWKVWSNKEIILTNMRLLEAGLFGKPLDKENWKKGELSKVKTKLVFKKNDKGQKAKD